MMRNKFHIPPRSTKIFNSGDEFFIIEKLGKGSFSNVYKVIHKLT